MLNRGVLNEYEADLAKDQRFSEMVKGLINRARYNYHARLEGQRSEGLLAKMGEDASGHNLRTDDMTLDGKNRISISSGNLTLYISTRKDALVGILAFAVYKGDLSKYSKTEWIQIAKTNRPLKGKPY